ncbi:MAG: GIY-YIG nuclease family protein [Holophagales bacterium]|nr:GIY-YIG nuclease family protein [Holophagales bacterium]MYD23861.1 GIY-YIG nuclease family protein [Holophagales bacterium]
MNGSKNPKLMPWSARIFERIPPNDVGLYAFWSRANGKCVYVGKAADQPLRGRLQQHWNRSDNETLRLWIAAFGEDVDICFLSLPLHRIPKFERRLIRLWRPEANIHHNPNRRPRARRRVSEIP